ncbi:hypothetical protein XENOCAPTIV_024537 [Xenoophorus captivus]|uniref:Striated muscle preferentially expressed protein kinase n=1 Tax=Xenoophorus captivus TaxID=1517983 RepID=A0ABV0QXS2_9TELE
MAVKAGESAIFECHITGPQDVEVDWLSNGKLIQPALLNCKMHFDGKRAKLEKMPSIPEEPEVLENELERRTMPDFVKPLADVEVIEGKETMLKCKVSGLPYPTIAWYHNGKRIESSEERKMIQRPYLRKAPVILDKPDIVFVVESQPANITITLNHDNLLLSESSHFTFVYDDPEYSLVIMSAKLEHSGVYTCTAKNVAGSVSCKAELTVHTERKATAEPVEDEGTILRKMRRLTDYYDVHKEIGSYKSKMVMRSIPELLNDSSNHVSIAVACHLKEGSPPPSSSSDSDADVDELPFIPMPLSMVFSGSRVSLNEIPGDEDVRWPNADVMSTRKNVNMDIDISTAEGNKSIKDEEDTQNGERIGNVKQEDLMKGPSVESNESQTRFRRATMRRGSSADSALLLHIDPEEGNANEGSEAVQKSLKKAVSMELPNRSPSPGATKLSQEDYALKLELMRQRLLRGGSVDKKLSGLRGPLFETLGIDEERQTGSVERSLRRSRAGPSTLTRAPSSESSGEDTPKTKVFRKSVSFSQGDSEPMPLHRRFGAPLEIPLASCASTEEKKLQEAISMSALSEQATVESASTSPREKASFLLPPAEKMDQLQNNRNVKEHSDVEEETEKRTKAESESKSASVITPKIVIEEKRKEESITEKARVPSQTSAKAQSKSLTAADKPNESKSSNTVLLPEQPAVLATVATGDQPPGSPSSSSNPDLTIIPRQPVLRTDIKDIDSEEVFEAKFKKRESSLTRGLRKLTRNKSEEISPVLSRKTAEGGEDIYRPGPRGAPLEIVSKGLQEKSKSVQDLREVDQETGIGRIGRFSLRGKRSTSTEKKEEKQANIQETAVNKRVSWAIGRSKSLDTKDLNTAGARRQSEEREPRRTEESSVSAMRRKFESKVAGISAKLRSQSEERKAKEAGGSQKDLVQKDFNKVSESPVLAMRHKFENEVAGISSKIRSQSEERKVDGEGRSTPLFARHRHSHSEGRGLKGMCIPENQLAKQTGAASSKESIESTSSIHSDKASESDRRSRWDSYSLERKREGDFSWVTVATGIADCYYNVTDLPPGGIIKFRVSCVNKAGQGPHSNCSSPVSLDPREEGASPAAAVVKTVPAPPEPVLTSSQLKPAPNVRITSTSSTFSAPPSSLASNPPTSPPVLPASTTPEEKQSSALPPSTTVKASPSFVLMKPQSPINVVTPMTQAPVTSSPPVVTPPSTPTKHLVASVPTYVPAIAATTRVAPTPVSFSPQVLQTYGLIPITEGASTPTRGTPSGRTTPFTALRQGVPQKPYTFLDEKARGRFGVIRECRENATGKIYMAKIIPYSQESKQGVLKEYEILKSLHNEKIMALHEAYVTPRYLVLVAEYCTGKELLYTLTDRARPTTRDCFTHAWLQDSYLMKLRRQTLTFTSSHLKEFLVEQQSRRTESATKHKVLLRTYQGSPQSPPSGTAPHVPSPQ